MSARGQAERTRDIPRNCACAWTWSPQLGRWVRAKPKPFCPWHLSLGRGLKP